MDVRHFVPRFPFPLLAISLLLLAPSGVLAHCDGLDGPVVKAAQRALDSRNPALVLVWVHENDEPEIRAAFERTLAVRVLGAEAKALADRFFFETVVRVHRAGEGAAYTGLKPAGRDLGPAIPAADMALDSGSIAPISSLLTSALQAHLREQFERAMAAKTYKADDVNAGRAFVNAYVEFIHYVERLHEALTSAAHGHEAEHEPAPDKR